MLVMIWFSTLPTMEIDKLKMMVDLDLALHFISTNHQCLIVS